MSIQDYLANEQFAYITRENNYGITDANPGDIYHKIEDSWRLIGFQRLISRYQEVIYNSNRDQWIEIITGPHYTTCTCYGNA